MLNLSTRPHAQPHRGITTEGLKSSTGPRPIATPMIRIVLSAAFDALAATLPLGSVGFERELTQKSDQIFDSRA